MQLSIREKLHIMVVDDMSTSRGLIIQALESFGIVNVRYAHDGATAFSDLQKRPAHLVISDYNMPGATGLQLLESLRRSERLRGVGFILITGRADREIISRGQQLGMNNFLKKPFENRHLLEAIEAVVGRL